MNRVPVELFGHAFGQNFSLPLPVWMFIFGGAAAVLLSFVLIGLLYDIRSAQPVRPAFKNSRLATGLGRAGKWATLGLFFIAVAAGFVGSPYGIENFEVTLFWVIFLVGFTYLSATVGNVWKILSPYRTIIELIERLTRTPFTGVTPYPARLGYYPALAGYGVIIWLELLSNGIGTAPQSLSAFLLFYGIVTALGCYNYGSAAWFRYCDFFSVYFRLAAKLSPFVYRRHQVGIRPPLSGILENRPAHMSIVLFVMFMLASTTFDGFTETRQYSWLHHAAPSFIPPMVLALAVLMGITLLLFGLYGLCMELMRRTMPTRQSARALSYAFVYTLIPIAIGYNIAHYLSYFVTSGQPIIQQVSDPFNAGWNLFGTAGYHTNPTPLSPYAIWYIQVGAIIAGHVAAVYLAHAVAARLYTKRTQVTVSQVPLIVLMVLYTTMSLWIIAQPVYIAAEQSKAIQQRSTELLRRLRQTPVQPPPPATRQAP